jgi:alanine racemase
VLPIGYADGLSRKLSNKGHVLIAGQPCPIVGKVTMDHTIVDVGDLPVSVGDEVVLIGTSGHEQVTAQDWAGWMDTINYEVTCLISSRVERIYV